MWAQAPPLPAPSTRHACQKLRFPRSDVSAVTRCCTGVCTTGPAGRGRARPRAEPLGSAQSSREPGAFPLACRAAGIRDRQKTRAQAGGAAQAPRGASLRWHLQPGFALKSLLPRLQRRAAETAPTAGLSWGGDRSCAQPERAAQAAGGACPDLAPVCGAPSWVQTLR